MKITKEQLKPLVKLVLTEMARRRSGASGEYELEDVEIDGIEIPGLATREIFLKFTITVEYNADPGYPATGMFGPPEHSEPGEGSSVEIVNSYPTHLEIGQPNQDYVEVNMDTLPPERQAILNNVVNDYVNKNSSSIEDSILDSLGDSSSWGEPDEPDRTDYYDR